MKPLNQQTFEIHQLERHYEHLRYRDAKSIQKLSVLIERYGQLKPIVVIKGTGSRPILIDGYARMLAMLRLGKDTLLAEVWPCSCEEGLLRLLMTQDERGLSAIEEANLLCELQERLHLLDREIARRIGRDVSWVSRRLLLLEALPANGVKALMSAQLSVWTAVRVIAPLARANSAHGEKLVTFITQQPTSTRELEQFYKHYQRSAAPIRQNMVDSPELFFKSLQAQINPLKAGPEHVWLAKLKTVSRLLGECVVEAPNVLYKSCSFIPSYQLTLTESSDFIEKINYVMQVLL